MSRVSGQPFAEFSRERLFRPLGMTHTSWRDDFTRIVKHRAIAYRASDDGFAQDMPFENVYGNGGLLTTVGDLLKWNANFDTPVVGDAAFVRQQQEPGVFNDGHPGAYAFGLMVGTYKGVREVGHSGSTAGYRAHLVRYPDHHLSIAVLCNVTSGAATQYAHEVADLYLGSAIHAEPPAPRPERTPPAAVSLTAAQLADYAGTYRSDEAEVTFVLGVEDGSLTLHRRPDTGIRLRPTGSDEFAAASLGTIRFHRREGRVVDLGVSQDRVFDLRFSRQTGGS